MESISPETSPQRRGSIGLQRIDPSPDDSDYGLQPDPTLKTPTSHLGLSGGHSHGAAYYVARVQRYSSYVFTFFTGIHLVNTGVIPLLTRSVADADTYLLLTRPLYQSPGIEPLVVGLPLLAHVAAGVVLRVLRTRAAARRYGASSKAALLPRTKRDVLPTGPPLSVIARAGYLLVPLVMGHVLVNRTLPRIYEGGSSSTGLGFVAHGFARHPVTAWTAYTALVALAVGHITWGWAKWLGYAPRPGKDRKRSWAINGVVAALASLWMAGGLGVVARGGAAEGWMATGYDALLAKVPLLRW